MQTFKNLKKLRQEYDLRLEDIADILGVTKQSVWSFEKKNKLPYKHKKTLEDKYNCIIQDSPDENIANDDIIELERIYIKPECGKGSELDSAPYIEPFRISRQTIQDYLRCSSPDNLKLFQAAGDSMEDRISDGDWLLVDIGRKDASISGIYVFKANERYRCKRLNMTLDGRLEVKSDNKKYDKEIVGPESQITIEIIGRVLNNLSKGII